MIRMEDFGEVAYGGLVTLTEWWDNKRIQEGKLAPTDLWKNFSLYTYLGIGIPATLSSAFGWWRRQERWMEHISHGFMYDFPRFVVKVVQSIGTSRQSHSSALSQAQEILQQRRASLQLTEGQRTGRSYQREFDITNIPAY